LAIVKDTIEHFFDQINKLDMSIQLKRKLNPSTEREALLADYKSALQKDVLNFSPEEISFIKNIFQDIFKDCNSLSKNIFPSEIKLIKMHGDHYGGGAFYTRENCILIPKAELQNLDKQSFRKTMLHELFHVYSRLNLQKKQALYSLIGFKSIGGTQLLQISDVLKEKIILNPDGINYAYVIQLRAEDKTLFNAIPLIISYENDFMEDKPHFFDYIKFDLYKIIPPFSRMIKVVSTTDGASTINFKNHPEFFEQITDNTDYIIHPDELMADNFMIAIESQGNLAELDNLSDSGKDLIKKVIEILKD
jgi:DNA-directed RNA polymerase subunit L